jgi:hypothetical protein
MTVPTLAKSSRPRRAHYCPRAEAEPSRHLILREQSPKDVRRPASSVWCRRSAESSRPYAVRRALLEDLLGRHLLHGLVLMPMTTDLTVARAWMRDHTAAGVEGVVVKYLAHPYRGSRPW